MICSGLSISLNKDKNFKGKGSKASVSKKKKIKMIKATVGFCLNFIISKPYEGFANNKQVNIIYTPI